MSSKHQIAWELQARGYVQLAKCIASDISDRKIESVLLKYLQPGARDTIEEQAKYIVEYTIPNAIDAALESVWDTYFKTKRNYKFDKMKDETDRYHDEEEGYSTSCEVKFPTIAIVTTKLTIEWKQPFIQKFEKDIKGYNLDIKALYKDKEWITAVEDKIKARIAEIFEKIPDKFGHKAYALHENVLEVAWDTNAIKYETETEEWSSQKQDWIPAAEGPEMDIRFFVSDFGEVTHNNKQPIKIENVKVDQKNVSVDVVATFSITFHKMIFPWNN
jgi:hypothetical protein